MLKADILDRIIVRYGLKNKTGLASFLGVSAQTISNWYSRNSIDYDLVFEKCAGLDLNWLVCGESTNYQNVFVKPSMASDSRNQYDVPVLRNKVIPVISAYGYMISDLTGDVFVSSREMISIPEYIVNDGDYVAFRLDNDAMKPNYDTGDCVVCKRVVEGIAGAALSDSPSLFALDGGELFVRRIEMSRKNPQRISFIAENDDKDKYPNMEIDVRDIKAVWSVKLKVAANDTAEPERMSKRIADVELGIAELREALNRR